MIFEGHEKNWKFLGEKEWVFLLVYYLSLSYWENTMKC